MIYNSALTNCLEYRCLPSLCCPDKHVRKHCEQFGSVLALRRFPEKGYAFVKYESHDTATKAICSMNGQTFCGQIIKVRIVRGG